MNWVRHGSSTTFETGLSFECLFPRRRRGKRGYNLWRGFWILSLIPTDCRGIADCDEIVVDYLAQTASKLKQRVAHFNICTMRNKMEAMKTLQVECNFDIIGITEAGTWIYQSLITSCTSTVWRCGDKTERNAKVADAWFILKITQVIHRKEQSTCDLEAIWAQIKLPTANVLFSVIYRSKLECPNFFESAYAILEKAWLKADHILWLGDFNCYVLNSFSNPRQDIKNKARKLLNLFEQFDIQNIIDEPTRVTSQKKDTFTTKPEQWAWSLMFNEI